jgi:hypothetical protein
VHVDAMTAPTEAQFEAVVRQAFGTHARADASFIKKVDADLL